MNGRTQRCAPALAVTLLYVALIACSDHEAPHKDSARDAGSERAGGGMSGTGGTARGTGGSTAVNANAPLNGPLHASLNPNYFEDARGRAVLLAGSHSWNTLQDWSASSTQQALDFDAFTRFLVAHGHNFTLLWRTELPKFCGLPTMASNAPDFFTSAQPWLRTGPGNADDGGLKFDLSKFDQAYFDRLRARVTQLYDAGIWTGVYLFTGEWLSAFRCSGDGYPFSAANNVNSIDDGGGVGSMTMTSPNAITDFQGSFIEKMIDTLADLPNVLWIVSEEAPSSTSWWQGHTIQKIRSYEGKKGVQHPIGIAMLTGLGDDAIFDTDADWVAPQAKLSPTLSCGKGAPKCKVDVNDSDHSYFGMWNDTAQQNREYAWENFTLGNNVAFMDPYLLNYPRENRNNCATPNAGICAQPDPRWDGFRDTLGYILTYSRKLDLNAVKPNGGSLCSTGYCLAQTTPNATEFLVYAPTKHTFTLDLSSASGRTLKYEWFDPAAGKVIAEGTVPGGESSQSFTIPAAIGGDSVLYLVDSAGHG